MRLQNILSLLPAGTKCALFSLLLTSTAGLYAQADPLNVMPNGHVGIGISTPLFPLDISASQGVMRMVSTTHPNGSVIDLKSTAGSPTFLGAINFNNSTGSTPGQIAYTGNNILTFRTNGSERVRITGDGNVAIGTINLASGYRLSVSGKVMCEELKVQLQANWPDYVFHDNYQLTSLDRLEKEIKEIGHLPGMPLASEVYKNGIEVGEMQRLLLEKMEELTLYVIDLQKQNKALVNELNTLKSRMR